MSERTDQLTSTTSSDQRTDGGERSAGSRSTSDHRSDGGFDDSGIDDDLLGGSAEETAPTGDAESGSRLGGYFSPRAFLGALVGLALLAGVGRAVVPVLSSVGGLLGAFAGAFVVGLVSSERRYAETGVAAALLGAVSAIPGFVTFGLGLQSIATIAAVGAGIGLVVALAGVYFGRDLRAGLTKDI